MVQKINPHPAPGCNRSPPPPTMYFQKMQFLGVFRPFLQRSLGRISLDYSQKHVLVPKLCRILFEGASSHLIFMHSCFHRFKKSLASIGPLEIRVKYVLTRVSKVVAHHETLLTKCPQKQHTYGSLAFFLCSPDCPKQPKIGNSYQKCVSRPICSLTCGAIIPY